MRYINKSIRDLFSDGKDLYFSTSNRRNPKKYKEDIKYMKYREGAIEAITLDAYYKARYGENYERIMAYFKDWSTSRAIGHDGSVYVCHYQESIICKFDSKGSLVRKYEEMGKVDTIYDIAVHGNSIWCAYPTSHTIKRFSLEDGSLEVSLSEEGLEMDTGTIFSFPESLSKHGDTLYVSDMGNRRVCSVDLATLAVDTHLQVDGLVFQYERLGNEEFVKLVSKLCLV